MAGASDAHVTITANLVALLICLSFLKIATPNLIEVP